VPAIQSVAAALAQRICDTPRAASAGDECAMVMAGSQRRRYAALLACGIRLDDGLMG
jgi:hypothetical protein